MSESPRPRVKAEINPPRMPWGVVAALGIPILILSSLMVYVIITNSVTSHRNLARIEALERDSRDGDRLLYLARLGMLRWMRACAYQANAVKMSTGEMERHCSVDLDILDFNGKSVR